MSQTIHCFGDSVGKIISLVPEEMSDQRLNDRHVAANYFESVVRHHILVIESTVKVEFNTEIIV